MFVYGYLCLCTEGKSIFNKGFPLYSLLVNVFSSFFARPKKETRNDALVPFCYKTYLS